MGEAEESAELRENMASLRESSLTPIAILIGAIGFGWFLWVGWPGSERLTLTSAWIGTGLLLLGSLVSLGLKGRYLGAAIYVLVCSVLGATVCSLLTWPTPAAVYLFILPIAFASVLLGELEFVLVAVTGSLSALVIGLLSIGQPFPSTGAAAPPALVAAAIRLGTSGLLVPNVVILLVAASLWLSIRNLRTALAWVWHGYTRARHNEREVREHQVQLKRVLRALDEATHRLERVNYTLTLTRDRAEEARRLKQRFAQTISHELRTPLNLIVGFTELMIESPEHYGGQLAPGYLRDLNIVHRNACHLQSLVDDVLDLARIEAAQMSLVPEVVAPEDLVRESVETAFSLVSARGLTLHTEIEPDLPDLHIDPTRIRQVLFNLLNNAAHFTEQGTVTVRVRQQGDEVLFAVIDTGVGIAPEEICRIFDEFHQADGGTRRRHEGAGLGLAISQRFVELHGGRIWAESEPGMGSTFTFSLPANGVALDGALEPALQTRRGAVVRDGDESVLLAVTQSPSAAGLLTRYVRGFHTIVVPGLEEAQRVARQLVPQLVVLDRTCGEQYPLRLEEIAQEWGLPSTPFVVCPLSGEESARRRLAVDGYVIKPVSRECLWDVLRQFGQDVDRVLVVDDDQDFVLLVSRMLEDSPVRHYQVISAHSGQEGLDLLLELSPDLVLLDLVLPDIPGSAVVERIRSTPGFEDTPIVIVSGQDAMDETTVMGNLMVTKAKGVTPGEVVRWVQGVADAMVTPLAVPK